MEKYWRLKPLNCQEAASAINNIVTQIEKSGNKVCASLLEYYLDQTDLVICRERIEHVSLLRRLTFPFAILVYFLLLISLPLKFIITGKWGYKSLCLKNWFKSVGL